MRTRRALLLALILGMVVAGGTSSVRAGDITGTVRAQGARHAGDAVVYVERIPGVEFEAPEEPVTVDQNRLMFVPHVLSVVVGTTVEFVNSDVVLHNVFTPDECAGSVDLGTWSKGRRKFYTFNHPCVAAILCNVHPEMEAFVIALETPYSAVSEPDGSFHMENVPAGRYTVAIWHERLSGDSAVVVVPETGTIVQDYTLSR